MTPRNHAAWLGLLLSSAVLVLLAPLSFGRASVQDGDPQSSSAQRLAQSFTTKGGLGSPLFTFEVLGSASVEQIGKLIPKSRGYGKTLEFVRGRVLDRLHGDIDPGTEMLVLLYPGSPRSEALRNAAPGTVFLGDCHDTSGRIYYRASPETKAAVERLARGHPVLKVGLQLATFEDGVLTQLDGVPVAESTPPSEGTVRLAPVLAAARGRLASMLPRFTARLSGPSAPDWTLELGPGGPLTLSGKAAAARNQSSVPFTQAKRAELMRLVQALPPAPFYVRFSRGSVPDERSASIRVFTDRGIHSISIYRSAQPEDATLEVRTFASLVDRLGLLSPCLPGLEPLAQVTPLRGPTPPHIQDEERAAHLASELLADIAGIRTLATFQPLERIPLRQRNKGLTQDGAKLPRTLSLVRCVVLDRTLGDLVPGDEFLVLLDGTKGLEIDPREAADSRPHIASLMGDRRIRLGASRATKRQLERVDRGLPVLEVRGRACRIDARAPWAETHGQDALVRNGADRIPYELLIEWLRAGIAEQLPRIEIGFVSSGPGGWAATVALGTKPKLTTDSQATEAKTSSRAIGHVTVSSGMGLGSTGTTEYDLDPTSRSKLHDLIEALPTPPASIVSTQSIGTPCASWLDIRIARASGALDYRLKFAIDDPATRPAFQQLAEVLEATGLLDHDIPYAASLRKRLAIR